MVVRGRTRNEIGPQGRVGSTPTISARIFCPQGNDPLRVFLIGRLDLNLAILYNKYTYYFAADQEEEAGDGR